MKIARKRRVVVVEVVYEVGIKLGGCGLVGGKEGGRGGATSLLAWLPLLVLIGCVIFIAFSL